MFCLGSFAIHNYYEDIDAVYDLNFQGLSGQSFLSLGLRTRSLRTPELPFFGKKIN